MLDISAPDYFLNDIYLFCIIAFMLHRKLHGSELVAILCANCLGDDTRLIRSSVRPMAWLSAIICSKI